MYSAKVNQDAFEVEIAENGFIVNGKAVTWDLVAVRDGYFHIIMNDRSYRAELTETDVERKRVAIKVNGRIYPVILKDKFDVLLEKMGMSASAGAKVNHVRAPMPGLIINLKVKEGDRVSAGDALIILEAMKMENVIKAPGDATVKSVKVRTGEGVEKNQVLIEFNPA
ncbi:MAG TPA: acetyl-CoA carboxylase biotin carboxyl carrier protein subunit [Chryseosolibacter sp.]